MVTQTILKVKKSKLGKINPLVSPFAPKPPEEEPQEDKPCEEQKGEKK